MGWEYRVVGALRDDEIKGDNHMRGRWRHCVVVAVTMMTRALCDVGIGVAHAHL